jgi:hypothetical protein
MSIITAMGWKMSPTTRGRLFLLLLLCPLLALGAPADDMKALLESGKAAEAYALGKQNPDQLGYPAFDFYFGVAAVDSGHAGEGVLALERYVTNFPANHNARLELARGYFVLGDDLRAREEFDTVLKSDPPADVRANIDRFLDAIRSRESRYKTTAGVYAEVGFGYDSNVNGGVGSPNITIPVFGNVVLTAAGVQQHSLFGYYGFGANVSHPVAPGVALFGTAAWDYKANDKTGARMFDQGNYGVTGGVSVLREKNLFRGTLSYSNLDLENDRYRTTQGAAGEVFHQLNELETLNGALQYAEFDYSGGNAIRDARFYGLGLGYRKAFVHDWQPLLNVSFNYALEDNIRNRDDLGRDIYGGRVALSATPVPKWGITVGATYQNSHYRAEDPLLAVTRKDDFYAIDATISYAISRELSVRGELVKLKNTSNLALYEYDRDLIGIKLRYDFK